MSAIIFNLINTLTSILSSVEIVKSQLLIEDNNYIITALGNWKVYVQENFILMEELMVKGKKKENKNKKINNNT